MDCREWVGQARLCLVSHCLLVPTPICLREDLLKEKKLTIGLSNPKEVTNQDLNSSNNVLSVELG